MATSSKLLSLGIKLSDEHVTFLRKVGNGSVTTGIRRVIDDAIKGDFTHNEGKLYVELTYADPFRRTIVRNLTDGEPDNAGDQPEGTVADNPGAPDPDLGTVKEADV